MRSSRPSRGDGRFLFLAERKAGTMLFAADCGNNFLSVSSLRVNKSCHRYHGSTKPSSQRKRYSDSMKILSAHYTTILWIIVDPIAGWLVLDENKRSDCFQLRTGMRDFLDLLIRCPKESTLDTAILMRDIRSTGGVFFTTCGLRRVGPFLTLPAIPHVDMAG